MEPKCWKCGTNLETKRAKFCPACGIPRPYDGDLRIEKLHARIERAKRESKLPWRDLLCFGVLAIWFTLVVFAGLSVSASLTFAGDLLLFFIGSAGLVGLMSYTINLQATWKRRKRLKIAELREQIAELERPRADFHLGATLLRASCEPLYPETLLRPAPSARNEEARLLLRSRRKDGGE